jgi:hypothetical protein
MATKAPSDWRVTGKQRTLVSFQLPVQYDPACCQQPPKVSQRWQAGRHSIPVAVSEYPRSRQAGSMRHAISFHAGWDLRYDSRSESNRRNIKQTVETTLSISRFNSQHEIELSKCGNTDSSVTRTFTAYECAQRTQQPSTPEGAQLDGPMRGPLHYRATNIGSLYATFKFSC